MFDIGSPKDFTFTTQSIFRRNAFGAKLAAKFDITPAYSPIWDFKSLAIFLNEMVEYEPAYTCGFGRVWDGKSSQMIVFHSIDSQK